MQTSPADIAQAEHIAQQRAERRHQHSATPAPLPDRPLIGERLHDHGDDSGRKARTEMADALADVAKQVGVLRRNPAMNAAQIEMAAADMVKQRIGRLLEQVETERVNVASRRTELADGVDKALQAPRSDWEPKAAELRVVLRGMEDQQRFAFLDAAKGTREERLVEFAIASVPAALSGVSFGIHKQMRDAVIKRHDPELLKKPADIAARTAALDVVEDGIHRTASELVDFDQADALRALASGSDVP